MNKEDLIERAQNIAVRIIEIVRTFPKDPAAYVMGKQIIRSSTSISANIVEAECAISRKEFILFMNISKREAKETLNWLSIIQKSKMLSSNSISLVQRECQEVSKILTFIVKTSQSSKNSIINHTS